MSEMVRFDRLERERLRQAYQTAIKNGDETFIFEGREYLVSYAKYLLEYLDIKLR